MSELDLVIRSGYERGAGADGAIQVSGRGFARGETRCQLRGVTYGPFSPNSAGEHFPPPAQVRRDFSRMWEAGINCARTYYVPPHWFLDLADEAGMSLFVDIPWSKHLCFLESATRRAEARQAVREAAERGARHHCLAAYSIGNEIPPDIVRWHGERRIERFLAELAGVVREHDPQGLVTYGNYPPTEYLDLSFLDFLTFNVYLHDRQAFRSYLWRLHNLAGSKPLVIGELGMDVYGHGAEAQAEFVSGHVREALLSGVAGTFVFSWTDDWHTGGYQIEDWAFGLTDRNRQPRPSYTALKQIYQSPPADLLSETPRVSVVVCSYNGGATLEQCLRSLQAVEYPNYEVVLVDDGSTDNTREIVSHFPNVRVHHQENQGLSAARNVGWQMASGEIIAYTDSDCCADPHWLTHLVHQFGPGIGGVGGPNLKPEDGPVAACVAASPGQPTHVLTTDAIAEHVPGCNMAFRREALAGIGGFDAIYRKAGDDVDVCWRLQDAGWQIAFAPGAFVWHHPRQTPRAYLRQQAGYGEAEALLRLQHPARFNSRGDATWHGCAYGGDGSVRLGRPMVARGLYAAGLFQRLYQAPAAHWVLLPSTLEWHALAAFAAVLALAWTPALVVFAGLLGLSLTVATVRAGQAKLAPRRHRLWRLLVALLCYAQPLVREWGRWRRRLTIYAGSTRPWCPAKACRHWRSGRPETASYWSEQGAERTQLLDQAAAMMEQARWLTSTDEYQAEWDLTVHSDPLMAVRMRTVQEELGSGRRVIRVRYSLKDSGLTWVTTGLAVAAAITLRWHLALSLIAMTASAAVLGLAWWRGTGLLKRAAGIFDCAAEALGLVPCHAEGPRPARQTTRAPYDTPTAHLPLAPH